MICPAGNTSIRNRPPLASSTTFAHLWAPPISTSSVGGQEVGIRHWTFGWAMTLGASMIVAAVTAAAAPLAFARNLRRLVITHLLSLCWRCDHPEGRDTSEG